MDRRKRWNLIANTTVVFVLASILEMTLHECGHFIAAISLKVPAVLHHNYVSNARATVHQQIIIASTGPLVSLLIGLLFGWSVRLQTKASIGKLFLLFMSVFGYVGCFGYMMVAPLFIYGDTGYVLNALGCPMWLNITFAITSVVILYLALSRLAGYFVSFMDEATANDLTQRRKFVSAIISMPTCIGIVITTALNLPSPTFLSLIAPICTPCTLFWVYGDYLAAQPKNLTYDSNGVLTNRISVPWVVVMIMAVALNRYLVAGVSM